jgi:hypothetical protein
MTLTLERFLAALKGFLEARLRPPRHPLPSEGEGESTRHGGLG